MPLVPASDLSRPNVALAAIVEQGIALQETHGTQMAARFLNQHKVGINVIARVLLQPELRRKNSARLAAQAA